MEEIKLSKEAVEAIKDIRAKGKVFPKRINHLAKSLPDTDLLHHEVIDYLNGYNYFVQCLLKEE